MIFNQAGTAPYSGTITGGGSVTVQGGAFTLTLGGTNSYSGGTTITGGMTVAVANNANLGDAGGGLTLNNGSLDTTASSTGFANSRFLTVGAGGGTITQHAGSVVTFNGGAIFATGGTLTVTGGGFLQINSSAWTSSTSNLITGIIVNQGTLFLGDPANPFSNPSSYLERLDRHPQRCFGHAQGGHLNDDRGRHRFGSQRHPPNLTLSPGSGGSAVTIGLYMTGGLTGSGPLNPTLSSTTTVTSAGTIIVNAGISTTGSANPLSGSSTVTLGSVTFNSGANTTIQTEANSTFQTGLEFGNGTTSSGIVTDHGAAMTFLGGGNSSAPFNQPVGSGVTYNGAGTTQTMTGSWTIGDTAGTNADIVTVGVQRATSPQFGMTNGTITVNPGSQLGITPAIVTFSNTQTITLNGVGPLDPSLLTSTLGAFAVGGKTQATFGANEHFVLGSLASQAEFNLSGGSGTQSTILTINGVVSGTGATLVVDGGGSLTNNSPAQLNLNGVNSLSTGGTLIEGANTVVGSASSIGTGALTFNQLKDHSPSLVLQNAAQTVGNLSSTYSGFIDPNTMQVGVVAQTLQLNGTVLTIVQTTNNDFGILPTSGATPASSSNAVITGSGSIVLAATSTAQLSLSDPNNSYTGSTTINGGTLEIYTDTDLGSAPGSSTVGQLTINGGTLHITSAPVTLAATRGLTVGAGGGAITTDANDPLTVPGVTKFGGGTLSINANSYLKFNSTVHSNSVTGGSAINVGTGAVLELAGSAASLSDGTNAVNVINNSMAATTGGLFVSGTNQVAGAVTGTGNMVVANGANLTAYQIRQNSLTINGNGKVTLTPSGSGSTSNPVGPNNTNFSSAVNLLNIAGSTNAWTSTLDIGNNGLVVAYGSGSDPYATIDNQIKSGFNGGTWTGTGITSSVAAAAIHAANPLNIGLVDFTPGLHGDATFIVFEGQTVTTNAILVRLTYMDDLVLSGDMSQNDATSDALLFAANYGVGTTWAVGDLTHDGSIDSNDALLFAANYFVGNTSSLDGTTGNAGAFGSAVGLGGTAAVPEPASMALAGLASLGLMVVGIRKRRTAAGRRGGAR